MSNNTVEQFAAELRRPVADLLKQLQEAGVSKTSGSDSITSDDKKLLLAYLKKSHGSESGTISIGRKKAEVSTVAGVQVETRRRARTSRPRPGRPHAVVGRADPAVPADCAGRSQPSH